ncbi:MAG TPA: hypothetical protein VNT23_06960 [Gaiellaceae bacterium]|nr:hypothetical protein [Gaiellaceae bacterium]
MKRRHLVTATLGVAASLALATTAGAHELDHPALGYTPAAPVGTGLLSGPPGAWKLVTTFPTGNPHTDLDFFTQGGETYAAVGTLAAGPNAGGQTIVQLTNRGEVDPRYVSSHPSASCVSDPSAALGLQHDVEATPKGDAILNVENSDAVRTDAQLLLDATDHRGRCHDQGVAGIAGAPRGGIEIVDITNVLDPVEIGLTSHIGEAHTVNVDPKRPHIAYAVTSDAIGVGPAPDYRRLNEVPGSSDRNDLDGFEVIDLSSCMNFPTLTSIELRRALCRPQVYRYRFPSTLASLGHTAKGTIYGCHELEVYPDDTLTCGSGGAGLVFDLSRAFDAKGKPRGKPLPCSLRPSSTVGATATGAMVTDCVVGEGGQSLDVPTWLASGAPSLEGVRFVGSVYHQGRGGPYPATEDNDFNHELELSGSGRFLIATDERGGGVAPPGATCATGVDNVQGNGGVHFYRRDALLTQTPATAEEAWAQYARTPDGGKAILRVEPRTGAEPSVCTAHVFQQIPGQNRIFMGWYSQGTQVVDFVEHPDGTVEARNVAWFIPENANTWTSHVFKLRENADGTFTYWGATGDFLIDGTGRSAIDVWEVTLPAPPKPAAARKGKK